MNPDPPANEARRLRALRESGLLDTPPEREFDDLAALAAEICGTPIALVSLVDETRQWFKARVGVEARETPREIAFCAHALGTNDLLVVPDAAADPRFADNPLVQGEPHIRFYAGAPLQTETGETLGTLCVLDRRPRQITARECHALRTLATNTMNLIRLRRGEAQQRDLAARLTGETQRLADAQAIAKIGSWETDLTTLTVGWSAETHRIFETDPARFVPTHEGFLARVHPDDRDRVDAAFRASLGATTAQTLDHRIVLPDGRVKIVEEHWQVFPGEDGQPARAIGTCQDVTAQRQALAERDRLFEQMRLLDTCVSHLNDVVVITEAAPIDEPGPRIIFVNAAFERLTGYTRAEAVGRSPRFLQGPRTQRSALAEIRRALTEHTPVRTEVINYTKSGREYWLEVEIVPVVDTTGQVTHAIAIERDITGRKIAEEKLRQSEALLRMASRVSRLGAWQVEVPSLRVTWSEEVGAIHETPAGFTPDAEGRVAFYAPEHRERIQARFQACASEGVAFDEELQIVTARGRRLWVRLLGEAVRDPTGAIVRVQGAIEDISARKAEEEAVRRQEMLQRIGGKIARLGGWALKVPENEVFWSDEVCEMLEYPRGVVPGLDEALSLYPPESRQKITRVLTECVQLGTTFDVELEIDTAKRRRFWVRVRGEAERAPDGTILRVVGAFQDITARKAMEQQLLRTQRMESIGTLAGGIAHDLNNLLAPITMGVDLLQRDAAIAAQYATIVDNIKRSADRSARLVRQVLSFARGVESDKIALNIRHVVREVESMMETSFPKNLTVAVELPADLPLIVADPTQLNQVLLNLCVNARDAMPGGGRLTLSVRETEVDAQYAAMNPTARPGRYLLVEVTDTGTGMTREVMARVFEPFYTTKAFGKGTGLGLATVMSVVRSHDGFVNVYSEVGRGSAFKVYLPVQPGLVEEPAAGTADASPPAGRGELILVVDDEAAIRDVTRKTLESSGYRVITAEDGAHAIRCYAEHRGSVAVVLTDLMMPVMDGAALTRALRRLDPAVRIVAASGMDAAGKAAGAPHLGVKHLLAKPYSANALLKTIRAALDGTPGGTAHGFF